MGIAYSETLTFVFPADTTVSSITVPFDSFMVNGIVSSPGGLNTLTCTPLNCIYQGVSSGLGYGCFILSGTPTANTSALDQLCVSITAFGTVFSQVQTFTDTLCVNFQACGGGGGCNGPTANFFFNAVGQTANITNTSVTTGTTTYMWNFGDGGTSTATNPQHAYINPGTYNICLMVTDSCGSDTFCKPISIGCLVPNTNFAFTVNGPTATFADGTSNTPTAWAWDFGDGSTGTIQNPTHTYASSGTYTVCLVSSNACGVDSICKSVTVTNCQTTMAAFSYQSTGLSVNFSDQSSTNPGMNWLWDFGDGNTSTSQNPSHTYTAGGSYTVCLSIVDTCGADSSCQVVTVAVGCNSPVSSFTSSSSGLAYTFTDGSTNSPTTWAWTFGDGGTSSAKNPTHTYTASGTYQVCLTVTSSCGSNTSCQTVNATCNNPGASFASIPSGLNYGFADQSLGNPTSWLWDFGDGSTSTLQNPTHTYASPGSYTVCLTATNACGSDQVCTTINASCQTTNSAFGYSSNFLTASFSNQTTGNPISYYWTFGDGGSSTAQNPTHTYPVPGTYTVCLTTTNSCGSDSVCQSVSIVCPNPVAAYSFSSAQNVTSFTDGSTNATSWFWNFGDGTTSTAQSPQHAFNAPGNYAVCLTATSPCGSHTVCKNVQISCSTPTASYSATQAGLTVNLTDGSSGATTWFWNFGDGSISSSQNTSHTYASYGTYIVCLTVTNGCNSSTDCKQIVLSCPRPTATWVYSQSGLTFDFTDLSTGGATSWAWGFGDGIFSAQQNPQHTYSQAGIYTVCLYATNSCGTDTSCSFLNTVGIEEGLAGQVKIYPNPSSGNFTLEMMDLTSGNPVQLRITDLLGREVLNQVLTPSNGQLKTALDLSSFANGSFVLRAQSGNKQWSRLLIKE